MKTFSKESMCRLRNIVDICNKILEKGERHVFYDVYPHCASIDIRVFDGEWEWEKEPCDSFHLHLSGDMYKYSKYKKIVKKLQKYLEEEK